MPGRPTQLSSAAALLVALVALLGCERSPYTDGGVTEDELPASGLVPAGGWESAPFPTPKVCDAGVVKAEDLTWPVLEGRQRLEVAHGLGRRPSLVLPYVAFEERGCDGTLASGDIARIVGVDRKRVFIENATKEHFFLRLYLE